MWRVQPPLKTPFTIHATTPCTRTHDQTHGGGLVACGVQYGLARIAPFPKEVGTRWQPSCCSPSHPHTCIWTHTNTQTHKFVDRLTAPAPTTPHPVGRWPMDRGHVAGRNASRQILCLSACLQITSLECLTKTEKEFCFPPF